MYSLLELSKMADDELDFKLAELCKWECGHCHCKFGDPEWSSRCTTLAPNFSSDLNAIHRIESKLDVSLRERYSLIVRVVVGNILLGDYNAVWHPLTAGARQRAEALVYTLGLEVKE